MKISYNWIKDFLKTDLTPEQTAEILTDLGLEVESIEHFESLKGGLKGVVVGEVLECHKHPNADKLSVTKVNLGGENIVQIVCGAPNVAQGQKVPVATIGTTLYTENGEAFQIKKGKIRGEESFGMICAEDELGLGKSHDGILVLDPSLKVGTPCSEVFQVENDVVFEIGLTPNRTDAMSHFGVARDLRAGLIQKGIEKEFITTSTTDFFVDNRSLKIDIQVKDKELVNRYCGLTLSNVKVTESPKWLQNRLKAIGISPKNNIVDATNYILHELGQPIHAFDAAKISDKKIIVRTAQQGEKLITLDGVERNLSEQDIVICDNQKPICLAGIMGGLNSAVTNETTSIFLESAYFSPTSIRKTAKSHRINSDASFRFERGVDINATKHALLRTAVLIKRIAGGEISSDANDLYPKRVEEVKLFLMFDKINRLIGQEIPQTTLKSILRSLDIQINSATERGLGLSIPTYRVDVTRDVDVIEEVLRVYGYNSVQASSKVNATMAHSDKMNDLNLQNITADLLTSRGFFEMMNNSLTDWQSESLQEIHSEENAVKLLNPLSNDLAVMRQNLLFSGLKSIAHNLNHKQTNLNLFEFGKSYHFIEGNYNEIKHLALFSTGNQSEEIWNKPQQKTDFFSLKSNLIAVLNGLGIENFTEKPSQNAAFREGIDLFVGDEKIASLGVVAQVFTQYFDIKQEVIFADILWDELKTHIKTKVRYTEIPKYPEVRRDLALLLDETISFAELYEIAFQTEKKLLKKVSLFDVYQGEGLPKNKKSYALSFILQDPNKTLTDKQISKIMENLQRNFEQKANATLR